MRGDNSELAEFLAYSVELESEAGERYLELADAMATHNNPEVAGFFSRMAREASLHLGEIEGIAGGVELPQIPAWEFNWPEPEAPESASYEAVHYRMSLREAILLALDNERAAQHYYGQVAEHSGDPETARLAGRFAEEEAEHAAALVQMLQDLPAEPTLGRVEDDDPNMPE